MVTVAVLKEETAGERRVALVPESVSRLIRGGVTVRIESGAGGGALIPDVAYEEAGAVIVKDRAELLGDAEVVLCVRRPTAGTVELLPPGAILIGLLQPESDELLEAVRERGVTALALERVPRITRAQSMDVLSSQSTVAGYLAVLLGAAKMTKFMPMLTTAAGAIPPAKALIIGAGVAGLQAIATARRLGAIVSGFDIRPAAAEQVKSLGASFVAAEAIASDAETAGGYAKEQSEADQERTLRALATHIADMDLVITTALIPGRRAPCLITDEMVRTMRPGSVIVDLAAEAGGNCALTTPGEPLSMHGVSILGPINLPSSLPLHASQMFSRNVLTFLQHLIRDGEIQLDREDEIVGPMLVATPVAASNE
jgi:H+-translocating NAD(P) transhydrogenase subunit alpha